MFTTRGLTRFLSSLTPKSRPVDPDEPEEPNQDDDPDYWYSDADGSREGTPDFYHPDSALVKQPMPQNHVPPVEPTIHRIYLSRLRIWCCQCLHVTNYRAGITNQEGEQIDYNEWPCRWCEDHSFRKHKHCNNCALVLITSNRLPIEMRYAWSQQALKVYQHPMYKNGGIGHHGPQFYVVECCRRGCAGVFRVDWDGAVTKRNPQSRDRETGALQEGLWVDFAAWVCPECGRRACRRCLKYVVSTQILTGSPRGFSRGLPWGDVREDVLNDEEFLEAEEARIHEEEQGERAERDYETKKRKLEVEIEGQSKKTKRLPKGHLHDLDPVEITSGDEWEPATENVPGPRAYLGTGSGPVGS